MTCRAANAIWLAGCVPEAARFRRAAARPRAEQERVLLRLLRANAGTEFGRRHGFSSIRSAGEYQRRVPVHTYDDYRPSVERVAGGAPDVLTRERVRMLEPTSGSSGAAKLVPYTASLQREFQRGIRPWIADLFRRRPDLMNGQAYWSVSPAATATRRSPGGIPIGFDDDSAYVGGWQQRLLRTVMAAPASLRRVSDLEDFRYLTLLSLVRAGDLRIVSVWHPTFLSWLVEGLREKGDALARDLPDARRADVLQRALRARTPEETHATLWPHLGLISCWADANAAAPAARIARLFPQARVQGKGLIATEGFVSFPLGEGDGAALAVRSHFLEFVAQEEQSSSAPRLADEIEHGRRYRVVISTGGGFYRYQLEDVVEVVGHLRQCPLVRFVGREGHVSDWFGEKLTDAYVGRILREAFDAAGVVVPFAMMACDNTTTRACYVLYADTTAPDDALARVARDVESTLRGGFHYDYARRLGQLGALRVFRAEGAWERYVQFAVRSGQRAGDVKPVALDRRTGWSSVFRGTFLPETARPSSLPETVPVARRDF